MPAPSGLDWRMGCFWRGILWMLGKFGDEWYSVRFFFISELCSFKVSFLGIDLALEIWLIRKWFLILVLLMM